MSMHWFVVAVYMTYATPCLADRIQISNASLSDYYSAIYYENGAVTRATEPRYILPGHTISLERPLRRWWHDRTVVITHDKSALKPILSHHELSLLLSANVGSKWGAHFYITQGRSGHAIIQSWFGRRLSRTIDPMRHAVQKRVQSVQQWFAHLIKRHLPIIVHSVQSDRVATVRMNNQLSEQELSFLEHRDAYAKQAWRQLFPQNDNPNPRIALVCSGGGYRTMLATIGCIEGLQQIGLFDLCTYITTLSGSTWAVAPWLLSRRPIDQYVEYLIRRITKHIISIDSAGIAAVAEPLLANMAYQRILSVVHLYGSMLADRLLRTLVKHHQWPKLSEQASIIARGSYPLPIYTAVMPDLAGGYQWFEFTPYEVGSAWLPGYIPSWALGRQFALGRSINDAPELSFGYLMGLFGSAFSMNLQDLIRKRAFDFGQLKQPLRALVRSLFHHIQSSRISFGVIPNFMYGTYGQTSAKKFLILLDAGISLNLPYPPVSGQRKQRAVDVIIFMDASAAVAKQAASLAECQTFAQRSGLPFARLHSDTQTKQEYLKQLSNSSMTVLERINPEDPLMIYMPLVQDEQMQTALFALPEFAPYASILDGFDLTRCIRRGPCNTTNFIYQPNESRKVVTQMKFNVVSHRAELLGAIMNYAAGR